VVASGWISSLEESFRACLLSELGGNAWSSPAFGDSGTLVFDCFFSRGLFAKWKVLCSNFQFFRTSDEKESLCKHVESSTRVVDPPCVERENHSR
jgi:hypothetical protein